MPRNNSNDLIHERVNCKVWGVVENIETKLNQFSKNNWNYNNCTITVKINDSKQYISFMSGTGKNEFDIEVFKIDKDGEMIRDKDNKCVKQKIKIDNFDETKHVFYNKKEIIEWGDSDDTGKNKKITYISELSIGRFIEKLDEIKKDIIGKTVQIAGTVKWKVNKMNSKITQNIEINTITLLKDNGKQKKQGFIIESPMIIPKHQLDDIVNTKSIVGYIPSYHKYVNPIRKNDKIINGRNVFLPYNFVVNNDGFMLQSADCGFGLDVKSSILKKKIELKSNGTEMAIVIALLNYKNGVSQREITIDDLKDDPIYNELVQQSELMDGDDKKTFQENIVEMYKAQNPATVRGEYNNFIEFVAISQVAKFGDVIFGIEPQMFELYSAEKILQEELELENTKNNTNIIPNIPKKELNKPTPPVVNLDEFNDEEFPF